MTLVLQEILSWRAILDIIVIAGGMFFLYRTLVRLGTWKIFVGILIGFLVFLIARLLRLDGVGWIFENLSQVAVLALIIIFQPELRKILEKVVSLYRRRGIAETGATEMIAASIWKLAGQSRGAILVYPGKEPITSRLSGGHALSAQISEPLIMSIFDPHSPGHDGALIIENDMVERFGVRLPMSQTSPLAEEFGTRHHAAMSLSETTDALVLVVSEERGTVSAFKHSKMNKLADVESIVAVIREHMADHGVMKQSSLFLRDRNQVGQFGVCLLLAAIFWSSLILSTRQIMERAFMLPVSYRSTVEDLIIVGDKLDEARVRVAGTKAALDDFIMDQPEVIIDMADMVEGTQTVLISGDNISPDIQVTFLESNPTQLELTLSRIVRKTVPIIPQLVGSLPEGVQLKKVTVVPESILIMAPSDAQESGELSVTTTPIYLNSMNETNTVLGKIIAPSTFQSVGGRWQDVKVVVEVSPEPSRN